MPLNSPAVGGGSTDSTYTNNKQTVSDRHDAANSVGQSSATQSDRTQHNGRSEAEILYHGHGQEPRLPNDTTIAPRVERLQSLSAATGFEDIALEISPPEDAVAPIMMGSNLDDVAQVPSATVIDRRDSFESIDLNGTSDLNDLSDWASQDATNGAGDNPLLPVPSDADVGIVNDAPPSADDASQGDNAPDANAPDASPAMDNADQADNAPGVNAPDAPPEFISGNPKLEGVWSAVTKRLTMPDLGPQPSTQETALKDNVDKYHGALDLLKQDISEIKPDAKLAKKSPVDSKAGAEELHQLKIHLRGLKDMNAHLAAVTEDAFPGDNTEYQHWQSDLQCHSDAFDSLMEIVELILNGDIIAALHDDHDKDKDKHKDRKQHGSPPAVPQPSVP